MLPSARATANPDIALTGVAISCTRSARNRFCSVSACWSWAAIASTAWPSRANSSGPEAPIRAEKSPSASRPAASIARPTGLRTVRTSTVAASQASPMIDQRDHGGYQRSLPESAGCGRVMVAQLNLPARQRRGDRQLQRGRCQRRAGEDGRPVPGHDDLVAGQDLLQRPQVVCVRAAPDLGGDGPGGRLGLGAVGCLLGGGAELAGDEVPGHQGEDGGGQHGRQQPYPQRGQPAKHRVPAGSRCPAASRSARRRRVSAAGRRYAHRRSSRSRNGTPRPHRAAGHG